MTGKVYNGGKLKRTLGLFELFSIAAGAMISSGIFVLPGIAHYRAGPAAALSYFLAGLIAATGVMSQAELASAMPRAGGTYFYITRSLGSAAGTSAGILLWLSLALKSSFALLGMAIFVNLLFPVNIIYVAIGLTVLFVILNLVGVREAAIFQVVLVSALLALLIVYMALGLPKISAEKILPFVPHGWRAVFSTAGFVFISYGGVLKIASLAEEAKNPSRNVPLAMILALVLITILYTFVVFVTAGVLDASVLDNSLTPLYDGAMAFAGKPFAILMAVAAIFAFISTANAGIMAASRYPVAMARDGILPPVFARIHPKRNTPYVSIIVTGAIMIVALFLHLDILVEVASTILLLTFAFNNINVMVMRESGLFNYRPRFRAPFYPFLQIAGIVALGFLIAEMGTVPILISVVSILAGFLWYSLYGRLKRARDSALARLVARITSSDLRGNLLETELREIIRERDGIVADRYDRLIESAPVLDIDEKIDMERFFRLAADKIAPIVGQPPEEIFQLLLAREREATTVLHDGIAVPHIIIPGEKKFVILLARAREGIVFPSSEVPVKIAVVMAGTRDERTFYLRALAATVDALSSPDFERRWLSAPNEFALKDAIIFARTKRFA